MTKTFTFTAPSIQQKEGGDILERHLQGQDGAREHICTRMCVCEMAETMMTALVPFH